MFFALSCGKCLQKLKMHKSVPQYDCFDRISKCLDQQMSYINDIFERNQQMSVSANV